MIIEFLQIDLVENAALFKGALRETKQQWGLFWENKSQINKHIHEYYILVS